MLDKIINFALKATLAIVVAVFVLIAVAFLIGYSETNLLGGVA